MNNKTCLPYLLKCMGGRKKGYQHCSVPLTNFPRSAEYFMFIEHTLYLWRSWGSACSFEIACFFFFNFCCPVLIFYQFLRRDGRIFEVPFPVQTNSFPSSDSFFLKEPSCLWNFSYSHKMHCHLQSSFSEEDIYQICYVACWITGTSDTYPVTVRLLLRLKPLFMCIQFCLFILVTCMFNAFTCTVYGVFAMPFVFCTCLSTIVL